MKVSNFVLLIIMLIILTPIPIKFSVFYEDKVLNVKVYNFSAISTNKKDKNLPNKFIKNLNKKLNLNYVKFINNIFSNINKYNAKPSIKLLGSLDYSLGDVCKTAITYGILSSFLAFLYRYISIIFKVNNSNFNINPIFKEYSFINIHLKCILYLSFGKIIYILVLILKSLIESREVNPVKGDL